MADFVETTTSYNAKRQYSPISSDASDVNAFINAINAFITDTTTTAQITNKEIKSEEFKAVAFINLAGKTVGKVTIPFGSSALYLAGRADIILEEDAVSMFGTGATVSYSESFAVDDTFKVVVSAMYGKDTFTITFSREFITITGFNNVEVKNILESYFDTIEIFGGEAL